MELCRIVEDALSTYRRANGLVDNGKLRESVHRDLISLAGMALRSKIITIMGEVDIAKARANFFIAQSVFVDRYHKREVLLHFCENTMYTEIVCDRHLFQMQRSREDGIHDITYIPQFMNVPCLRRFRIDGKYYITVERVPELMRRLRSADSIEDLVVDTMLLNGRTVTFLHVDGKSRLFDCTGHFPILVGYDTASGQPLYVAVLRANPDAPWYFTTVEDGASSVTYTDEVGEVHHHVVQDFFVLALRYDPVDLPSIDSYYRRGAKDPTGPVYWLEFFPQKDERYKGSVEYDDSY
ncbi:hypothetical protein SCHPADRAFT_943343 [Schizopora paradoxa]|uniref:Uncharacterized protein n=1 Tax=Schizopora paradoxa TaxID=27342 RepID=A0A0H2RYE4_9AGAM|nr:hypothetical protein SCHPADRAFT_943343 [Schizopora paradoxa]